MEILGISAFYHDSAAALVRDGEIVAAAQEERFSRKKHDHAFPRRASEYCLEAGGIEASDLDYVVFYEKPLLKFDRLIETYFSFVPAGFRSFREAMPLWLREKLFLPKQIDQGLGDGYEGRYVFTEHHESHAAAAFFPSPFKEAAILTMDGVGEWATATIGHGVGNRISIQKEIHFPHSLGLLYSAFTYYCGFRVNSGEYKLMGLAPYGEPKYVGEIKKHLIKIRDDGSFWMDMRYFRYCQGLTMTGERFHRLFGAPPRKPETKIETFHMDLAASIQKVTEEVMLKMAAHAAEATGSKNLCLAGGVALNCVGNGRILRESPFDQIWIQPAGGDAGGALGCALFAWHQLLDQPREVGPGDQQGGSFLGPRFERNTIREFLETQAAIFEEPEDSEKLCRRVADALEEQKVIGWFQGRMEFGPRALGARSILGDARSEAMQSVMNLKIKFRESFRPFAPIVLRDRVADFFDMPEDYDAPYMLIVAGVREEKRRDCEKQLREKEGFEKLAVTRSEIPAVTHVDFSARVQTVDGERHGKLYDLMREVERRTGCPVMINTSFNVRGEPIVCTPEEAYRVFMATEMDVLVLGEFVLFKDQQPEENQISRQNHLEQFELD